jgi:hypothetical protein
MKRIIGVSRRTLDLRAAAAGAAIAASAHAHLRQPRAMHNDLG